MWHTNCSYYRAEDITIRNSRGFSLIEVIIAIAVFAILAAIAVPNLMGWLPKRQLQRSAIDMQASINLAKMIAIKENSDVVIAFDPANENYLAFIDTDEDGSQDAGERTIRSQEMSPGIDLNSTTIPGHKLTFNGRGLADNSGDIILRNKRGDNRTINITITGISRIN
jgi:type IV fimbrial biogenesis protein FimT